MLGLGLGSQPTTECGIFGSNYAVEFDGIDGAIRLPQEFLDSWNVGTGSGAAATAFSMSMWVNVRDNDGENSQNIIAIKNDSSNNGFQMVFHRTHLEFRAVAKVKGVYKEAAYKEAGYSLEQYIAQGWIHLTMTFNHNGSTSSGDGEIKIYKNGVLKETVAQDTDWGEPSFDGAYIGANENGDGGFADGYVDQLAIFDTTLSSEDVTTIYNSGVMMDLSTIQPGYSPRSLVAYYQFENNTLDSGVSDYHGVRQGGVTFTTSQP